MINPKDIKTLKEMRTALDRDIVYMQADDKYSKADIRRKMKEVKALDLAISVMKMIK